MKLILIGSDPDKTRKCLDSIAASRNINPSRIYISRRPSRSIPNIAQFSTINREEALRWPGICYGMRRVSFSNADVMSLISNTMNESNESIGIIEDSVVFSPKIPFCCNFIAKYLLSSKIKDIVNNERVRTPKCFIYDNDSYCGLRREVHPLLSLTRKDGDERISSFGGIILKRGTLDNIMERCVNNNIYAVGGLLYHIDLECQLIASFNTKPIRTL